MFLVIARKLNWENLVLAALRGIPRKLSSLLSQCSVQYTHCPALGIHLLKHIYHPHPTIHPMSTEILYIYHPHLSIYILCPAMSIDTDILKIYLPSPSTHLLYTLRPALSILYRHFKNICIIHIHLVSLVSGCGHSLCSHCLLSPPEATSIKAWKIGLKNSRRFGCLGQAPPQAALDFIQSYLSGLGKETMQSQPHSNIYKSLSFPYHTFKGTVPWEWCMCGHCMDRWTLLLNWAYFEF